MLRRLVRFAKLMWNMTDDIWRVSCYENVTWSFDGVNDKTEFQKKLTNIKSKATKEKGSYKEVEV